MAVRHPVSLHQLTVLDAKPERLVRIAGELGCDHVSLFTQVPDAARTLFPVVSQGDVPNLLSVIKLANVTLCNIEVFALDRDGELARFAQALQVGQALGATRATAQLYGSISMAQGIDRFLEFCRMAQDHGITPGLEFHRRTDFASLAESAQIVREAGCGTLVIDALHLMRNGADVAGLAAQADLVGYAQLCDGPATIADDRAWTEAVDERALPGEGVFPLDAIIASLAPTTVIETEVPQGTALRAGMPPEERARRAVEAVRTTLARAAYPA